MTPPGKRLANALVHATADVASDATIGAGSRIWQQVQIRSGASIGAECILGKGVYIDVDVHIGDRCKLENATSVFKGFNVEAGVFLGPGVMLLNDKNPRAINPDGSLKSDADWVVSRGNVGYGAAIGGGAIVLPGVRIGQWALVGSGAVVTKDVPDHGMVWGNPARLHGFACVCGRKLDLQGQHGDVRNMACLHCGRTIVV